MAHQTGIEPSKELNSLIATALNESLRYIKIGIENEVLVPAGSAEPNGSFEDDMDSMIQPLLVPDEPCYIYYRLDEMNSYEKYFWIFLTYNPDDAKVRDKMLYAATKATVKKVFQSGLVIDEITATTKEELTLEGYKHHKVSQNAAPPLTDTEKALKELQSSEDHIDVGTSTRQSHMHGVRFPIKQDALDALKQLKSNKLDYVQLAVDTSKEEIYLERTDSSLTPDVLSEVVPDGAPRYHFFVFKHSFEGDYQESVVFIYSCPGFKTPIKERMLYSSCKEPLISLVEGELNIKVVKKLEMDSGKDLCEEYLMDEVHPQQTVYKPKFMKPPGPQGRKRSRSPGRSGINSTPTT